MDIVSDGFQHPLNCYNENSIYENNNATYMNGCWIWTNASDRELREGWASNGCQWARRSRMQDLHCIEFSGWEDYHIRRRSPRTAFGSVNYRVCHFPRRIYILDRKSNCDCNSLQTFFFDFYLLCVEHRTSSDLASGLLIVDRHVYFRRSLLSSLSLKAKYVIMSISESHRSMRQFLY